MRVKILYWLPDDEFIYLENFRSLTDHIFQFNFRLIPIIRSFKPHNWLRHKSFKSHTFNACKWPRWAENKTVLQDSSLKINRLNQLYQIMKLACPFSIAGSVNRKYWWRLESWKGKFQDVGKPKFSWLVYDSNYNVLQKVRLGYLDCISSKFTLLIILCFFICKF